jgi:DNA-directed RNA polymerase subunit RPC12/RpoP
MLKDMKQASWRCWKCEGALSAETAIDLHTGYSTEKYVCETCGRRWDSGQFPRPIIAA